MNRTAPSAPTQLRPWGPLLGVLLACGGVACSVEVQPATDALGNDSPPSPGGKADSAFGSADAELWSKIAARCTAPADDEPIIYTNDFHWNYTPEEMAARYEEIYGSGQRLTERARFDEETGSFIMPTFESWGGQVTLPKRLVENVTRHLELALEAGYAEHVFFPDMGHSHYFIPQARWEAEYADTPVDQSANRNSRLLDDPELLVFYHTAEQLQMLDEDDQVLPDPHIEWRHQTRNVVGDNDEQDRIELLQNPDSKANTSRDYPGHRYFGAGFSVSASTDGCFPFIQDGELKWYDLSLSDLPYKQDGGNDWM
jgi:hypothetical protein